MSPNKQAEESSLGNGSHPVSSLKLCSGRSFLDKRPKVLT